MEQCFKKLQMYITPRKRCPHFPAPSKIFFSCGFRKETVAKERQIIMGDKMHLKFKVSRRGSQLPAEPYLESLHLSSKIKASTQVGFFRKTELIPQHVHS